MTDRIFEELFERYPRLEACRGDIYKAFELMSDCYDNGGKLLCCGNGGSAADCDHLVGELMKGFLKKRPFSPEEKERFGDSEMAENLQKGLPAISLCAHSALMTAFENDAVPALVFAQQVCAYLSENCERKFTMQELSAHFSASPSLINKCFSGVYGMTPPAYLRAQKMYGAAQLLRGTDRTVLDIAGQFGYDNASKFAKAFRGVIGVSPAEYRSGIDSDSCAPFGD